MFVSSTVQEPILLSATTKKSLSILRSINDSLLRPVTLNIPQKRNSKWSSENPQEHCSS